MWESLDLWWVMIVLQRALLVNPLQQIRVKALELLDTFLLLARSLNSENLRESADVFENFLFLVSPLFHQSGIQLTSLGHELIKKLDILILNLSLFVSISVGLDF